MRNDLTGLKRTRVSVLKQSFDDWEHIVVADSPEDSSAQYVASCNDNRVLFEVQEGSGIFNAMNLGIRLSQKPFVLFLNAGDVFHDEDSLASISEELHRKNPEWAIFGGVVDDTKGNSVELKPVENLTPTKVGFGLAGILHPSVLYRNDFIRELSGYREEFRIAGDLELNIRAAQKAVPLVGDQIISIFHLGGISSQNIMQSIFEAKRARKLNFKATFKFRCKNALWAAYQIVRHGTKRFLEKLNAQKNTNS